MRSSFRTVLFVCVLGFLVVFAGSASIAAPPQQGQNLLVNPSFEGPFRQTSRSSWVSEGWNPWFYHTGPGSKYFEPEWKVIQRPKDDGSADLRSRLQDGDRSLQWFNTYALHRAGIWQRVQVPTNSKVTFTIWVQILSARETNWVDGMMVSGPEDLGNYQVQCGIDPTGWQPGGQVLDPPGNVVWSPPIWDANTKAPDGRNQFAPCQVSTQAQGNFVTVWTRGMNQWAFRYEAAFVDNATLTASGAPPPPRTNVQVVAPVKPTNTPLPTNTPTPTFTPTSTPTPTFTPTPTATSTSTPTPTFTPTFTPSPTPTSSPTPLPTLTPTRRPRATPIVVNAAGAGLPTGTPGPGGEGELFVASLVSIVALSAGLFIGKRIAKRAV